MRVAGQKKEMQHLLGSRSPRLSLLLPSAYLFYTNDWPTSPVKGKMINVLGFVDLRVSHNYSTLPCAEAPLDSLNKSMSCSKNTHTIGGWPELNNPSSTLRLHSACLVFSFPLFLAQTLSSTWTGLLALIYHPHTA